MSDIRNNDTFTTHFHNMVERVGESDEIITAKQNVENSTNNPIEMDNRFKEDVLTVVNVIKTCEEEADKTKIGEVAGTFFAATVGLFGANTLLAGDHYVGAAVFGGAGVATFILALIDEAKRKKRAAADAVQVRATSGLDNETMKIILQQLAQEGSEVAKEHYAHYYEKEAKGKSL
mgnify:CR=1 FL=1